MKFLKCHSAENCKRGGPWDFLTSIALQSIETNEVETIGGIQKPSKKSPCAEKNLSENT